MTSTAMGEGERAEAAQRRRKAMLVAASVAIAVAMVAGTAIFKQGQGQITSGWSIAFVALYLLAMLGIGRFTCRVSDEVARRGTVGAVAAGGFVYALVYPSWYFLWRGNLVPEPSHEALYVIAFLATMIAYLWNKLR